jgi:O-antigen biosynthesis protein
MPAEILPVDITEPLYSVQTTEPGWNLKLLVMRGARPIGMVDMGSSATGFSEERIRYQISRMLSVSSLLLAMPEHPMNMKIEGPTEQPLVSIVVCTANRPDNLERCLDSLMRLSYPHKEIIVVDNNPSSGLARAVAERYPVEFTSEPRRGLSFARNAGISRARGEIIALTDDDCRPTEEWLERLVRPFAEPQVMCVTGLVIPEELENEAQELFEEYGGLGRGFEPKRYGRSFFQSRKLRAVPTWQIGATANAAFRASGLKEIGPFDVTLGVGTPTGCSEDTYAFYKLLNLGYEIVYEPRAYVYHRHRSNYAGLRKQLFGYSRGHYAYHVKCLFRYRDLRALFHMLVFMPLVHLIRLEKSVTKRSHFPIRLILWELLGNMLGPGSLVLSWWVARRCAKSTEGTVAQT